MVITARRLPHHKDVILAPPGCVWVGAAAIRGAQVISIICSYFTNINDGAHPTTRSDLKY
jgi:hypothetical protein